MSRSSRIAALHLAREPMVVHADGRVASIEQKDALRWRPVWRLCDLGV